MLLTTRTRISRNKELPIKRRKVFSSPPKVASEHSLVKEQKAQTPQSASEAREKAH